MYWPGARGTWEGGDRANALIGRPSSPRSGIKVQRRAARRSVSITSSVRTVRRSHARTHVEPISYGTVYRAPFGTRSAAAAAIESSSVRAEFTPRGPFPPRPCMVYPKPDSPNTPSREVMYRALYFLFCRDSGKRLRLRSVYVSWCVDRGKPLVVPSGHAPFSNTRVSNKS